MNIARAIFAALLVCVVSAQAQSLKSLMYNTTNGEVVSATNVTFTNGINFTTNAAGATRTNLRLGITNTVVFSNILANGFVSGPQVRLTELKFFGPIQEEWDLVITKDSISSTNSTNRLSFDVDGGITFENSIIYSPFVIQDPDNETTILALSNDANPVELGEVYWNHGSVRSSLGLGATNTVTFAGLTNNGNITINQSTTNNGLLYIYRTNAEPFLGLANLIASNNTTISNETLFRVGAAEATNKSAQFGFRSTNTNGNGVAVFSVFGYNALMMIGPSDPNAGTNPIQATVYSIAPTNKVMTLITTNTGAMQMHRPIGIDTAGVSTNAPANTTNVAGWIQFYVGTNSVRVPYYQ